MHYLSLPGERISTGQRIYDYSLLDSGFTYDVKSPLRLVRFGLFKSKFVNSLKTKLYFHPELEVIGLL